MRALVACGLVLGTASLAAAAPTVRLHVASDCPTPAQVAAALEPHAAIVAAEPVDLTVEVEADADGVTVRLAAGARAESHRLAGHDCATLAGAIAALTDVWLVELAAPPPLLPPPPPLVAPTPPSAVAPRPQPIAAPRWFIGAGRALVFATAADRTGATRIDAAWRSPWRGARLRLTFDWGDAATLASADASDAERQPWTVAGTVGWRSRGRAWAEAGVGGGLVVSHIDAMSAGALRVHPTAVARATGGWRLGLGVSVRAELEAALYPVADRYLVAGAEVGHSPWASVAAGLGIDIALGAK